MKDLSWFRPDGKDMSDDDWNVFTRYFGLRVGGNAIADVDAEGRPVVDDVLLSLINVHWEAVAFVLPACSIALFRLGRANRSARVGRHVQAADGVA